MTNQRGMDRGLDHAPSVIWLHDPNANPPNTRLTIAELAARVCKKDHEAYEMLYKHYQTPLGKHLMSLVYDKEVTLDLYQDTFERVWKNITQKITDYFQPWLYDIAAHRAIDYLRHKKLIDFQPLPDSNEHYRFAKLRIDGGENRICDLLCLKEAVALMTPKYRVCMVMQYYWGFTQQEIASLLDISEKAVSTNASRGRQQIIRHQLTLINALKGAEATCDAGERDRLTAPPHVRGGGFFGESGLEWERKYTLIRDLFLQPDIPTELPTRLQKLVQNEGNNSEQESS